MKIIDTHAHYDDEQYDIDRDDILKEVHLTSVKHIVNCGSSLKGMRDSVELAKKYDFVHAAVGIHPSNGFDWSDEVESEIRSLMSNKKVVAIGEIGLDYYWEELNPSHEHQKIILEKQYVIAREFNKPVVLHIRDSFGDMTEFLLKNTDVPAVLHSYSGSVETAIQMTKHGFMLGIGGVVTFKNARKLIEVVEKIPIEYLMTETDAPYLTAHPFRGKRNRSDYIKYVVEKIAEIKNIDPETTGEILYNNAIRFFRITE